MQFATYVYCLFIIKTRRCTIQKNDIIDLHLHDKTHIFSSETHKRALESLAIKITTSFYEQTTTHMIKWYTKQEKCYKKHKNNEMDVILFLFVHFLLQKPNIRKNLNKDFSWEHYE